jgi:hypothetical protein
MRTSRIFSVCIVLLLNQAWADSRISGDQHKLLVLSSVLKSYEERSGGQIPADLKAIRDYSDLPWLLRAETDPLGSFPDRYAFLPAKPWMEAPGEPPRQLLLISVKPLSDGSRGAVWRYRTGEYSGGNISARELEVGLKNFNLTNLKPMGGQVPAPTHPSPEPPITEYQAKVMQLVGEGKITPQPRNPEGKEPEEKSEPSPGSPEGILPRPMTPSRATGEFEEPPRVEPVMLLWPWLVGIATLVVIVALVFKRRA